MAILNPETFDWRALLSPLPEPELIPGPVAPKSPLQFLRPPLPEPDPQIPDPVLPPKEEKELKLPGLEGGIGWQECVARGGSPIYTNIGVYLGCRLPKKPKPPTPPTPPKPDPDPDVDDGGDDGGGGGGRGGAFDTQIHGVPINDFGLPQFDDPGTALLEDLVKIRLDELFQPVKDPARQQYADELQRLFGSFREPRRNPEVDTLIGNIRSRIGELTGPVFSAEEENLLRTRSLDDITRAQDVAEQRAVEQFGGRGLEATSGVRADVLGDIAREFAGLRSREAGEFGRFAVGERQRRQERALDLGEQVRGLEEGEIQRGETRGLQGLTIAQELAQLAEQIRVEEQQRRREAIAQAGLLAELPERRLQLALATLGTQPPPGSLFNQLAQLVQLGQGQQGLNLQGMNLQRLVDLQKLQQQQGYFSGLGSMLGSFGDLFNTGAQSNAGGGAGLDFSLGT